MTTERRPRPRTPPGIVGTTDLKRIPLPALPHFRGPGPAPAVLPAAVPRPVAGPVVQPGPVSPLEMSELLKPDHEGGIAPAIETTAGPRTGATGATILNDLVDEIEKGLEKDLARAPAEVIARTYGRVVACAGGAEPSGPAPPPAAKTDRRTGE